MTDLGKKVFTFKARVSPQLFANVTNLAKKRGISVSELVRRALVLVVENPDFLRK